MRKTFIVALTLLSTATFAMPRNSFLIVKARNLEQLLIQSGESPVSERYCNFFGVTQSQLKSVFATMRQKYLTNNHNIQVWRCTSKGYGVRYQNLKKGTLVWVFSDGTLALLSSCGNPLSRFLPISKVVKVVKPVKNTIPASTIEEYIPPVAPVPVPTPTPPLPILPPTVTPTPSAPTVDETPGVTRHNNLLPFVLAGVGVYALTTGNSATPVPEPSSLLVLGLGIAMIAKKKTK